MATSMEERVAQLEAALLRERAGRRRLKLVLSGALVATLGFWGARALANPTVATACAAGHSHLLYCFLADSPALSAEVNHNFETLAAWVEQKVGQPAADAEAAPTTGGGVVVVRQPTGTANLALDGDEIDARLGAAGGPLNLQTGAGAGDTILNESSGNTRIGGTASVPNTAAKLQVGGTASIARVETGALSLNGGSTIGKVAFGTYGTCTVAGSAPAGPQRVNFGVTFANVPQVTLTPEEADGMGCTSVRVLSRDTTGFSYQAWTGGTASSCDCIHWLAISQ